MMGNYEQKACQRVLSHKNYETNFYNMFKTGLVSFIITICFGIYTISVLLNQLS